MKIEVEIEAAEAHEFIHRHNQEQFQIHQRMLGMTDRIKQLVAENKQLRAQLPTVTNWERSQLDEEAEKGTRRALIEKMRLAAAELEAGKTIWEISASTIAGLISGTDNFEFIIKAMRHHRQKALDEISGGELDSKHIVFCVSVNLNNFNGELREECIIETMVPFSIEGEAKDLPLKP